MNILLSSPRSWKCYKTETEFIIEKNGKVFTTYRPDEKDEFLRAIEDISGTHRTVEQFNRYVKTEWIDL